VNIIKYELAQLVLSKYSYYKAHKTKPSSNGLVTTD